MAESISRHWYALVDGNNFYVSCERAFSPRLQGRPVGVLSNNDGCIIARSDELKALGVRMGTPPHQIRSLVRRHKIKLLSSNYSLYADMSRRLNDLLSEFCPEVQPYSIDESFVRMTGFYADGLLEQGRQIEAAAHQWLHLPVSVGIAPTRTLAKLANRCAKQRTQNKTFLLDADSAATQALLKATPVDQVWGIGSKLAKRLEAMGIETAWQLREAPLEWIAQRFSVVLQRTQLELRGIEATPAASTAEGRQQLRVSRTFGSPCRLEQDCLEAVQHYVQRAAEKLRAQRSETSAMTVFLRTNPYRSDLPQFSESLVWQFDQPTDDTTEMLQVARRLLRRLWQPGYVYQKAGVLLMDLTSKARRQQVLFETPERQIQKARNERLMQVIDTLNQQQGRGKVGFGLPRKEAAWPMRQANRSPEYTTDWADLPEVVAR